MITLNGTRLLVAVLTELLGVFLVVVFFYLKSQLTLNMRELSVVQFGMNK